MSISHQNTAWRSETELSGESAATLGAQLLALLPALRLHSVSMFNAKGDVQWLSEGALGPDEQTVVEEAISTLKNAVMRAHFEVAMPDGRAALFLAVRTPRATLAGVVMVLMDAKLLNSGNLAARILTTSMRAVLQKVAMLLAPPPPHSGTATLSTIKPVAPGNLPMDLADLSASAIMDTSSTVSMKPAAAAQSPTLQQPAAVAAAAPPVNDVLAWNPPETDGSVEICFDADPLTAVPRTGEVQALPGAPTRVRSANAPKLRLRELLRLRAGGRTRRYQVVAVAEQERGDALITLNHLLTWLKLHPEVLRGDPLSFTIGVSAQSLNDAGLPAALASALSASEVDPGTIGFELREAVCISQRMLAEQLLAQCERSRCFAVIDDFTFDTAVLDLLRSNAVRLLKVDAKLVAAALKDKLAQARVIAIAQATKVLGMHCAAKYVDTPAGRRWIAAVGFDFNQSITTEPLTHLSELTSP